MLTGIVLVFCFWAVAFVIVFCSIWAAKNRTDKRFQERNHPTTSKKAESDTMHVPDRLSALEFQTYMNMFGPDMSKWN